MIIKLKKPAKRISLYKVFSKAVSGYRELQKQKGTVSGFGGAPGQMIPYYPKMTVADIEKMNVGKLEEKEEEKSSIIEGNIPVRMKEPEVDLKSINIVYTLIASGDKTPFASANIKWSRRESSLIYYLIEPVMSENEKELLKKIKTAIIEKLDVDFTTLRREEARSFLILP